MATEKQHIDDTFLARWVAGELSPEELETFKKSKDYPYFKRINDAAQTLKAPTFDRQSSLTKFKQEKQFYSHGKTKRLIPNWVYSAAAAIVIGFGVFFFMNGDTHYETSFGEQLAITLPDNSKVQLNANSTIDFNKSNWDESRELYLNGEAFFDVEKGTSFKVVSEEGIVEVLGTAFNVISRAGFFEVLCHEGNVRVSDSNHKELAILHPGKAFRLIHNDKEFWSFSEAKPTWLTGESSFKNTPLTQVIKALENQYAITFVVSALNSDKRFTGSFTHGDLEIAMQTVFTPLNISYTANKSKTITLTDKN